MKVIYDIGDELRSKKGPDFVKGPVSRISINRHGIVYFLTDVEHVLEGKDAEPVMVKGIVHRCPKCGNEFGEKSDD